MALTDARIVGIRGNAVVGSERKCLTATMALGASKMSSIAKRKVQKVMENKSARFGQRLCIDASSVAEHASTGGGKFWLCVVDDFSGFTWSRVMKKKSDTTEEVASLRK